jgi:hypothetical protein
MLSGYVMSVTRCFANEEAAQQSYWDKPGNQRQSMTEPTAAEIREIVMAEYRYWRTAAEKGEHDEVEWIAAGCMAASANILCAIYGHRAPWHPQIVVAIKTEEKDEPTPFD